MWVVDAEGVFLALAEALHLFGEAAHRLGKLVLELFAKLRDGFLLGGLL